MNQVPKSCPTLTSTETLVIMSVKYFQRGVECHQCQSTVSLVTSVFKKIIHGQVKHKNDCQTVLLHVSSSTADICGHIQQNTDAFSMLQ